MKIVLQLNLFLLAFGLCLACQAVQATDANVFGGWIILPAETTSNSWGFPKGLQPLWNPPTNLVADTIQRLPAYLRSVQTDGSAGYTNQLAGMQERLPNTGCQIVGVTLGKQKGILLNCIPLNDDSSKGWKKRFIKVFDGGPRWWSVVYLPDKKEFTRLRVDLGY